RASPPDGNLLGSSADMLSVCLWEVKTGKRHSQPWDNRWAADALAFSADGSLLAAASMRDAAVRVWDLARGREARRLALHVEGIREEVLRGYALAFSSDGKLLACGDLFGVIYVWEAATGKLI